MKLRPFFALLVGTAAVAAESRLNVLFIASDDMRPQLGLYGDQVVKSPNLDRLAARGLAFDRAFCQMALCSPSRISLLSGRRPATTKVYTIDPQLTVRTHLPDITTLPQHFKNNGYYTRSLGKIYHVGIDDDASWSEPAWHAGKLAPRLGPVGRAAQQERVQSAKQAGKTLPVKGAGSAGMASPAFESVDCADDELLDGACAREAIAQLRAFAKNPAQPFFLAVGFANPHVPWVAPKKYFDLYDPAKLILPANNYPPKDAPAYAATTGSDFLQYAGVPQTKPLPADFGRQCLHAYLAAISYVDAQVGRLLAALEETGLAKNTIVVFWGDHGYYMGEHSWWGGKHNNYHGATRVPLLIAVPGQKTAGRHSRGFVEFVDLYPSLSDLCGLPAPRDAAGLEGTSFAPLLADPDRPWKKAVFSQYPKGGNLGTAMETERYRYVEWRKGERLVDRELYDHANDAAENQNVAARPEYAAAIANLEKQMSAGWRAARP
ncbi:MAG: sulfatase [Verrucomicrobia bacterium]|nr:sulfatase [Verrucomicrobiota bacterium]